MYSSRKDKFEVKGHEDDEPFQRAYFKKMLNSFCNPGYACRVYCVSRSDKTPKLRGAFNGTSATSKNKSDTAVFLSLGEWEIFPRNAEKKMFLSINTTYPFDTLPQSNACVGSSAVCGERNPL